MAGRAKGQSEEEYQKMLRASRAYELKKHKKRLQTDPAYNQEHLKTQHDKRVKKFMDPKFNQKHGGYPDNSIYSLEEWERIKKKHKGNARYLTLKKIARKKKENGSMAQKPVFNSETYDSAEKLHKIAKKKKKK